MLMVIKRFKVKFANMKDKRTPNSTSLVES